MLKLITSFAVALKVIIVHAVSYEYFTPWFGIPCIAGSLIFGTLWFTGIRKNNNWGEVLFNAILAGGAVFLGLGNASRHLYQQFVENKHFIQAEKILQDIEWISEKPVEFEIDGIKSEIVISKIVNVEKTNPQSLENRKEHYALARATVRFPDFIRRRKTLETNKYYELPSRPGPYVRQKETRLKNMRHNIR